MDRQIVGQEHLVSLASSVSSGHPSPYWFIKLVFFRKKNQNLHKTSYFIYFNCFLQRFFLFSEQKQRWGGGNQNHPSIEQPYTDRWQNKRLTTLPIGGVSNCPSDEGVSGFPLLDRRRACRLVNLNQILKLLVTGVYLGFSPLTMSLSIWSCSLLP